MAWIKSKCGKYELEFKKMTAEDMPDGWEADPKNLPSNTRRLKDEPKAELAPEVQEKAEEPKQEAPKVEEKQEEPKESKKGRRGRRKKEKDGAGQ